MKKHYLTDGNGKYIRYDRQSNKYVQVNTMSYADSWDTFDKSEKIRKSSLSKELRRKFYTISIEIPGSVTVEQPIRKSADEQRISEVICTICDSDIGEQMVELLRCAEKFLLKKDELVNRQSNIDKEITDLQHYIEQKNLNAYEGFKVYKQLQNVLIQRRCIKDELLILKIIEECKMEPDSISRTISRINGLSNRKYAPRILSELFSTKEGGAMG